VWSAVIFDLLGSITASTLQRELSVRSFCRLRMDNLIRSLNYDLTESSRWKVPSSCRDAKEVTLEFEMSDT
jgi:hypothetical protein